MKKEKRRGQRLVKRIYTPRIVGIGLGLFCVVSVFYQQETPIVAWILAITYGLFWPHVAYLIAKNSSQPYKAERRNLLIDSFFGGVWVPLMAFSLLPSFIIIVLISMSNISVGGVHLFLKGVLGHLLGGILAIVLFGFNLRPDPTMLSIIMCLPVLMIFPIMIGMIAHKLSQELNIRRKELQANLDQIKTLSGLLPICSACKKIRNDNGYWSQIETYIRDHSEADFSHSICPECVKTIYPDLNIVQN